MQVIKHHQVISDSWHLSTDKDPDADYPIASEFDAEEDQLLLDYSTWKDLTEPLRAQFPGIVLASNERLNIQPKELRHLNLIAIVLRNSDPSQGISLVKFLRDTLRYKGEIRAMNVDAETTQLAIMGGFDSIEIDLAA